MSAAEHILAIYAALMGMAPFVVILLIAVSLSGRRKTHG